MTRVAYINGIQFLSSKCSTKQILRRWVQCKNKKKIILEQLNRQKLHGGYSVCLYCLRTKPEPMVDIKHWPCVNNRNPPWLITQKRELITLMQKLKHTIQPMESIERKGTYWFFDKSSRNLSLITIEISEIH